jgi:hypothetical protein
MKIIMIIGLVLIALGVVGLIYGGITYTSSKDLVNLGSVHVQVDQKKQIPLSPIAGAVAVAIGTTFIIIGQRRRVSGSVL